MEKMIRFKANKKCIYMTWICYEKKLNFCICPIHYFVLVCDFTFSYYFLYVLVWFTYMCFWDLRHLYYDPEIESVAQFSNFPWFFYYWKTYVIQSGCPKKLTKKIKNSVIALIPFAVLYLRNSISMLSQKHECIWKNFHKSAVAQLTHFNSKFLHN